MTSIDFSLLKPQRLTLDYTRVFACFHVLLLYYNKKGTVS